MILEEEALKRPVGGPAVMRAQLLHLLAAAKDPAIAIRVLPTAHGAHAGPDGSFSVLDFADPADPAVAYVAGLFGNVFIEKPDEVRRFAIRFEHMREGVLGTSKSADLIERIAHDR
jgi:hypothetical protein